MNKKLKKQTQGVLVYKSPKPKKTQEKQKNNFEFQTKHSLKSFVFFLFFWFFSSFLVF